MIRYTYVNKGIRRSMTCPSMNVALATIAKHHESCGLYTPHSLDVNGKLYTNQDMLLLCKKYNYL